MFEQLLGFDPFAPKSSLGDYLFDMKMGGGWRGDAAASILRGSYADPDYVPRYRMPNRRFFWQLWKPKWRWVEGVSMRQMQRVREAMDEYYRASLVSPSGTAPGQSPSPGPA
jgi:hypothetical protein